MRWRVAGVVGRTERGRAARGRARSGADERVPDARAAADLLVDHRADGADAEPAGHSLSCCGEGTWSATGIPVWAEPCCAWLMVPLTWSRSPPLT